MTEACYTGNGFETEEERAQLIALCARDRRGELLKRLGLWGGALFSLALLGVTIAAFGTAVAGVTFAGMFLSGGSGLFAFCRGLALQMDASRERSLLMDTLIARKQSASVYVQPPYETQLRKKYKEQEGA